MYYRISILILLLASTSAAFAQTFSRDSLIVQCKAALQHVKDSLAREPNAWISYFPYKKPGWAENYPVLKVYTKNCKWSGTSFILNTDSGFFV